MTEKLLRGLQDLGYSGPLLDKKALYEALQIGPKSIEYTQLVHFLTNELRTLLNIDEEVNPISGPEDSVSFIMEISSFLKELNCAYTMLTQGHISDRLQNYQERLLLLDYLATELMGARILQEIKPEKKIELKLHETSEAANMRQILMTLRFPKPPPNITIKQLFQKVCPTVQSTVQKVGKELIGKPAFSGVLTDKQWETLNGVQKDLHNEYKIRREMLLTRLDVTIQSFQWSDKTKGKDEMFEKIYNEKRKRLKTDPDVELSDLLVAREDIAIIEKTSNSSVRKNTRSSLNKVIIGRVPDRGGRTSELAPPPPEMPSWQQRSAGPSGGRGGGRGGGNFGRQNQTNQSGGYGGNRGGFDSNRSGYDSNRSSYDSNRQNQSGGYSNTSGGYSNKSGGYSNTASSYSSTPGGYSNTSSSYSSTPGGYSSNKSGGYSNTSGGYSNTSGGYSSTSGGYGGNKSGYDSGYSQQKSFDSAGSYTTSYGGGSSYSKASNYESSSSGNYSSGRGSYGSDSKSGYSHDSKSYDSAGSYGKSYDSAGSYGKDYSYEQDSKRVKTYDSFQSNRTTYADQYVKEEQQNQQYHGRGNNRSSGRGRSNYSRGGRSNY